MISVIVTTYERPDALDVVLRGLAGQDERDFEVIVADDGSGPETAKGIAWWRDRLGVTLTHVHQPDEGFRAAEARNRALLVAAGDYVVFLDGDCLPRADFLTRHRALAEPGWFVAGNRILLAPDLTRSVLTGTEAVEDWSFMKLLTARLDGEVNRLLPLMTLPGQAWRKLAPSRWRGARTCNLAAFMDDLVTVDGFDASYQGWGLEDTDLVLRLMRAGVKRKDGRFATGVFHLWHPENDRAQLPENQRRLDAVITSDRVRAERGLSALRGAMA
jgi:glycosyltransferase involved in cell wall biosynthesis